MERIDTVTSDAGEINGAPDRKAGPARLRLKTHLFNRSSSHFFGRIDC
jgi:hypothetical protein